MLTELENCRLTAVSSLYQTSPVGIDGGAFLNAAARVETRLGARDLLMALLAMETDMGRARTEPERSGSRHLDLDLLLHGSTVLHDRDIILPHPRMLERRFVMEPLAEMAPGLEIPPSAITAGEAAARLERDCPEQEVVRLGTLEEVREIPGIGGLKLDV